MLESGTNIDGTQNSLFLHRMVGSKAVAKLVYIVIAGLSNVQGNSVDVFLERASVTS